MSRRYRMEGEELAAAEALGPDRVPPEPRAAAGIVLARDGRSAPEILLVRRRADVGFAAGAYVFPGGTLDADDSDPAWGRVLEPHPAGIAGAADPGGPSALTFVVAALRETFEETGVLLTRGRERPDPGLLERERAALLAGNRSFLEIVSENRFQLAAAELVLCARWVTPEALSRRYDARFFLASAPAETHVSAEKGELVEHLWIRPAEALDAYFDFRLRMLFPTARTLEWLSGADTVADLRSRFLERRVERLLPRLRRVDGEVIPVLPGDPRYDEREGDG